MAQGVGYTTAAFGPPPAGLIRDRTGGLAATAFLFVAQALCTAILAMGAGRALHVGARTIRVSGRA